MTKQLERKRNRCQQQSNRPNVENIFQVAHFQQIIFFDDRDLCSIDLVGELMQQYFDRNSILIFKNRFIVS
jgi:hypothetical protein